MYRLNDLILDPEIYNNFLLDCLNIEYLVIKYYKKVEYGLFFISDDGTTKKIKLSQLKDEDIELIKKAVVKYNNMYNKVKNKKNYFLKVLKELINALLANNCNWRTVNEE